MLTQPPSVCIRTGEHGISIEQHRPALTDILRGMEASDALARIPVLLPICGTAQSIAAGRAVAAARETSEPEIIQIDRAAALAREQALAAGWRLALDWPDLLAKPRELTALAALRRMNDPDEMAQSLGEMTPGLEAAQSIDDILQWVESSDSLAAEVVRRAQALDSEMPVISPEIRRTAGAALAELSETAFGAEPFNPLEPATGATEVGPLAMARDPLINELDESGSTGPLAGRLLAQLLDTRFIAGALSADPQAADCDKSAWMLRSGEGMGSAMTARGPVFHKVRLAGETVSDWRVLAPTDWHLSPAGPLIASVDGHSLPVSVLRLLVAGFDPCAPWRIDQVEPAYA